MIFLLVYGKLPYRIPKSFIECNIMKNEFLYTNKESAHPLGNGFWRALESQFLVPKNEAPCS